MTRALVVVESMFGNTEQVAGAVADGLSSRLETEVVRVGRAPESIGAGVGLLVVGGPTHAFGLSRQNTRKAAVEQGAHPAGGPEAGLREWLAALRPGAVPVPAAAFDTRVKKRGIPGSAARGALKRLARLGFRPVAPAETFWVSGTPGPLLDGELDRARSWGVRLAADLAASSPSRPEEGNSPHLPLAGP